MKKASAPKNASLKVKNNCEHHSTPLTPRMERLLLALVEGPQKVTDLQKKIPANNAPEYVSQLRRKFGLTVPCKRIAFVTVDRKKSTYGVYALTSDDLEKARKLLVH